MTRARRRPAASGGNAPDDDVIVNTKSSPPADTGTIREMLRRRWELASVLNFLHVFEPVIGSNLKMSAEDIETALIELNNTLAQLHIALLKGIHPRSKALNCSDAWVTVLAKTISIKWHWVAEGDFPLTRTKGEETSSYKELEPISRLLILKALCEVRSDQQDVVSYINEAIKTGTQVTKFRMDKLAGNGREISFWYDGHETIGHRLYKEVSFFENDKVKLMGMDMPISCQWETVATNLEEFKKIVDEYSSSEVKWEMALSSFLKNDVIPILIKHEKKKQGTHFRKQREHMLLNGFRSGISRSCRNQKFIDYRFDDYDKAITEAIQYTNEMKKEKLSCYGKKRGATPHESGSADSFKASKSTEIDAESYRHKERDDADNSCDRGYDGAKDGKKDWAVDKRKVNMQSPSKRLRYSERLAGFPSSTLPESLNLGAKNRLKQRPSVNTAAESAVIPDSDDESS